MHSSASSVDHGGYLAKHGAALQLNDHGDDRPSPPGILDLHVMASYYWRGGGKIWQKWWDSLLHHRQTKIWFPVLDERRSRQALYLLHDCLGHLEK